MKILILRSVFNKDCTIGEVYVNGTFYCYSLEPVDRGLWADMPIRYLEERKVANKTAIPYGKYKVIWNYSYKFKRAMPLLMDVPCFSGIRIHSGNYPKDTAGCIMLGNWTGGSEIKTSRKYTAPMDNLITDAIEQGETVTVEIRGFTGSRN